MLWFQQERNRCKQRIKRKTERKNKERDMEVLLMEEEDNYNNSQHCLCILSCFIQILMVLQIELPVTNCASCRWNIPSSTNFLTHNHLGSSSVITVALPSNNPIL